jgi:hypothetical protein
MNHACEGPVVFARYAYPPNALGYCGPDDPAALLGAASGQSDLATLHALASRFEGAWPYLQLIAACNHIADPLDWRVTKAYWVGNSLLDNVPQSVFTTSLDDRFSRRAGRAFAPIAGAVPLGGVPHHSFHVFAVYPWLGMLRAGMEGPPLRVLDRCRIRWGRIEAVLGDRVVVRCRTLRFHGSQLFLGDEQFEEDRVSVNDMGFVDNLERGDLVSLHWDWVCDRLSEMEANRLRHYTMRSLAAVNSLAQPGPAVAVDTFG